MLVWLGCASMLAAEPPVAPVRVCDVLQDLTSYNQRVVAVIGRYSFRQTKRFLSEDLCEHKPGSATWPNVLRVSFDPKSGPKPLEHMEFDPHAVYQKLRAIQQHTSLARIRFGTPDYDRWAVVWGRVEPVKEFLAGAAPAKTSNAFEPAPAELIVVSDIVVMFIEPDPAIQ